jgi:hypothetical protein
LAEYTLSLKESGNGSLAIEEDILSPEKEEEEHFDSA